jgi:serine/threonine protein phosphatase PrpC
MKVACKSDVGRRRDHNEDCILVDAENGIFLVADGMGGHQAGEVASETAVQKAYDYLHNNVAKIREKKDISENLTAALLKAHDAVKEKAMHDQNFKGMGTTLVEMVTNDNRAYICHVGDTRAYLIRENATQITKDQTLGNYLVEKKNMPPEEVPQQKWHTLTQAVGVSEEIRPELNDIELKIGDIVLLCSDGLTDMLSDRKIEEVVHNNKDDLEGAVEKLIDEANQRGGKDNISVVLVKYD